MAADILIVDDEADIRELIGGILEDEGYEARLAADSDSALQAIADRKPSMVVLDIWLQGSRLDGLELLEVIKERHPDLPVVIISGHGNIETAVSAIKRGAYDYIEKPFKADRLVLVVGRALENWRLRRENEDLRGRTGAESELIGNSAAMRQLRATLKKVAPTNSRVLDHRRHGVRQGADGTGAAWLVASLGGALRHPAGRHHGAGADRGRAVRHRGSERRGAADRGARGGAWRHALHRRGRRHAGRDPGQGGAGAGRADLSSGSGGPRGCGSMSASCRQRVATSRR